MREWEREGEELWNCEIVCSLGQTMNSGISNGKELEKSMRCVSVHHADTDKSKNLFIAKHTCLHALEIAVWWVDTWNVHQCS